MVAAAEAVGVATAATETPTGVAAEEEATAADSADLAAAVTSEVEARAIAGSDDCEQGG